MPESASLGALWPRIGDFSSRTTSLRIPDGRISMSRNGAQAQRCPGVSSLSLTLFMKRALVGASRLVALQPEQPRVFQESLSGQGPVASMLSAILYSIQLRLVVIEFHPERIYCMSEHLQIPSLA